MFLKKYNLFMGDIRCIYVSQWVLQLYVFFKENICLKEKVLLKISGLGTGILSALEPDDARIFFNIVYLL